MTPEQRTHAIVHNAADRALSSRGYWVPLGVRSAITEAVLAALADDSKVITDACGCGQPVGVCPCGDPRCWHCDPGLGARYTSMVCNSRHAPERTPGTIQGAFPARGGMSGCSDDASPAEALSAPHGWNRTQDANGRTLLWKVVDSGDLIVGAPLATPIAEEKPHA